MATEEDRTETGVAGTAIAIGVAAMIAGSAALVGMARTEVQQYKEASGGFADLESVNKLRTEQLQQLTNAKLSIEKAKASTLEAITRDPAQASPWSSPQDLEVPPSGSATPAEPGDGGVAPDQTNDTAASEGVTGAAAGTSTPTATGTAAAETAAPRTTAAGTAEPGAETSPGATAAEPNE